MKPNPIDKKNKVVFYFKHPLTLIPNKPVEEALVPLLIESHL